MARNFIYGLGYLTGVLSMTLNNYKIKEVLVGFALGFVFLLVCDGLVQKFWKNKK